MDVLYYTMENGHMEMQSKEYTCIHVVIGTQSIYYVFHYIIRLPCMPI